MPQFTYTAKKGPQEVITGVIEADTADAALVKVMQLGVTPIDIKEGAKKVKPARKIAGKAGFSLFKKVSTTDICVFTRQASDLIGAGVPILRALGLILNQTKNKNFKVIIEKIHTSVKDGGTLSNALAQHPQVFSQLYTSMVRSGELSGNLDVVLARLAVFAEKDMEIRARVSMGLAYPLLILLVGIASVFVLLTFVIPRFSVMFEDLNQTLPLPTTILINLSDFFARFAVVIILGVVALGVYLQKVLQSPKGQYWFDNQKLKLPVIGKVVQDVEIARFARTLGTLVENGVVIVSALKSVWAVLDNVVLKEEIRNVSDQVANGASLMVALRECHHFPEIARNMISVGEETGKLEQGLFTLADSYERQSDRSVQTLVSLLGPIALIGIVSIVGFVVISMLLPIFKMNLIVQ